ncbi:MAG: hypothetical protein ABI643_02915 [Candidatus Doudnabacteria bacterium]
MPSYTNTYSTALVDTFRSLYDQLLNFLPGFLVAVVILVVGLVLVVFLANLIKQALHALKLDELGDKLGLDELSSRTGMKLSVSGAVAWLFKWFLLLVLFLGASDILGLTEVSKFLNSVLMYIPNVVAAAAILLVGTMLASFLSKLVRHSVIAAGLSSGDMLGAVTQWAVMIFTILATLDQLKVAALFVSTLFTGFIAMLAIAGGLAFGLGGRDHATKVLNRIEKDLKS